MWPLTKKESSEPTTPRSPSMTSQEAAAFDEMLRQLGKSNVNLDLEEKPGSHSHSKVAREEEVPTRSEGSTSPWEEVRDDVSSGVSVSTPSGDEDNLDR